MCHRQGATQTPGGAACRASRWRTHWAHLTIRPTSEHLGPVSSTSAPPWWRHTRRMSPRQDMQGRFRLPSTSCTGVLGVSDSILEPGVRSTPLVDERQLPTAVLVTTAWSAIGRRPRTGTAARARVGAPRRAMTRIPVGHLVSPPEGAAQCGPRPRLLESPRLCVTRESGCRPDRCGWRRR